MVPVYITVNGEPFERPRDLLLGNLAGDLNGSLLSDARPGEIVTLLRERTVLRDVIPGNALSDLPLAAEWAVIRSDGKGRGCRY